MVSILLPFVDGMLHPDLVRVVKLSGYPYVLHNLDRNDVTAYARLVRATWSHPADTVIVEHDVVPTICQIEEICECGHDWCGFNYDDGLYPDGPMFGCVRFSRRLMVRHPQAAEVALRLREIPRWQMSTDDEIRRAGALAQAGGEEAVCSWWNVDNQIARDLAIRQETWHAHSSRVHHAHSGPASGPQ